MKRALLVAGSLAGLVLFGAGCPSASPQGEGAAVPQAPVAIRGGKCDNAYFPLKKGTKMTYATHYAGRNNSYSWEVTDATDDSAKLTYTFSPTLQLTSDIRCTDDGLLATTFLDMGSAVSGGKFTAKTVSASGSILPKDLHAGSVWSNRYEVEVENNIPGAAKLGMKTSRMTVSATNTAIGEESVTVPAGTFTAMKVESKMTTHMVLGAGMPAVNSETTSIDYFVKGKGLVKSETLGIRGATTTDMEATSIEIP